MGCIWRPLLELLALLSLYNSSVLCFSSAYAGNKTLSRRFYSFDPNAPPSGFGQATLWPDSTIPYCFRNDNSRTQLESLAQDGWKLWVAAGVGSNFHFGEYNRCPAADPSGNVPYGSNYLIIEALNGANQVAATTTANQLQNWLKINPDPTKGTKNPTSNMAHEIGHALGFLHEHQRPDQWDSATWQHATGNKDAISFDCRALRDYATAAQNNPAQIDAECKDYVLAKQLGFYGAEQYLPYRFDDSVYGGPFDWLSIMLYGSQIGGYDLGDGNNQNVWRRASDLKAIPYNLVPSQSDVQRLKNMYTQKAPYPNPCLLTDQCNPMKGLFYKTVAGCKNLGSG